MNILGLNSYPTNHKYPQKTFFQHKNHVYKILNKGKMEIRNMGPWSGEPNVLTKGTKLFIIHIYNKLLYEKKSYNRIIIYIIICISAI